MVDDALLEQEVTRFALRLVTEYPVSDVLHDVMDATTAIFGIRGAGTSLARDDRLSFATAHPAAIAALEGSQEQEQSGPCVDAYRHGRPVLVTDVTAPPQAWPRLAAVARQSDIVAIAAFPLWLNGSRLGSLDLYDTGPRTWTPEEVHAAELLAALTTGYLVNASRLDRVRHTAEQLQAALESRVVIEQAKGRIAGERGISVDQAFELLRAHARRTQAPLRDIAQAVVHLDLHL